MRAPFCLICRRHRILSPAANRLEILSSLPFGWMVTHFGISAKSSGSVQTPKTDPCHGKILFPDIKKSSVPPIFWSFR
jgi:hypothetical protein